MILSYADPQKINWFLVSWTLSNKCNYRCSYCPQHLHSGYTGQPLWTTVERFIKNFSVPGKEICYRISGGEPTYYKHFIDMAKAIKNSGHIFSFLTNGSQSVEYYSEINPYTDGLILSYHHEYCDVKHFVEIANLMNGKVVVNLMLTPDNFNEIMNVAQYMYDNAPNMLIWPKIVLDKSVANNISNKVVNYTTEQKKIIKDWPYKRVIDDHKLHRGGLLYNDKPITANDLILRDLNVHTNWQCYGGIDMINIDMWGNMYRSDCQQGGPLGNIERWMLPTTPIICNASSCNCLSDIYLRKHR